jgi:hypothetical protein
MVTAGEPMVISPPRLELGDESPSEEALEVECAVVARIADADNNDTLPCGATGDSARQPDEEDKDTPYFQLDEDEDYNFGFLNEREEGDQDEGDTSDDEDDATPNPDAEGGASAAQESGEACVFSAEEAMAMAAVVGYPVLLKTSEGTAGVLKVQCAEQMASMYHQAANQVTGTTVPVKLMRLLAAREDCSEPKMTAVSSPLPMSIALGRNMVRRAGLAKGATGHPLLSLQSPVATQALVQSPLTTLAPGLASAPASAGMASSRQKGTSLYRMGAHATQANLCHPEFVCNCSVAKSRGRASCLKQFSPEQLTGFHRESFGVYIGRAATNADVGPTALGVRIHGLMWPLREPLKLDGTEDEDGRSWEIRTWKLGNRDVCRAAWECAYGAAKRRYRTIYGLVQRGHAPHANEASMQAKSLIKLMARVNDASGVRLNEKRSWAANWWKNVLLLMDWLPDEQRIRIRGPGFKFLHANVYRPRAMAAGLELSYKTWKGCMKQGVLDVCYDLPGSKPEQLKVGRAARHSNFPECTSCLTLRNRWLAAAKSSASDPATVQVRPLSPPRAFLCGARPVPAHALAVPSQ